MNKKILYPIDNKSKRLFFSFLRKHNALKAYKKNFKNYRGDLSFNDVFSSNRLPSDYIIDAFLWRPTPEGYTYWEHLDQLWRDIIRY